MRHRVVLEVETSRMGTGNSEGDLRRMLRGALPEAEVKAVEVVKDEDALRRAIVRLYSFEVESNSGDEPFLSESFLYDLIGKEDARTVLALLRRISEAAGLDPLAVEEASFARWDRRRKKGLRGLGGPEED